MEVLELKNKNFLEGLNNRFEQAGKRIGAFEDEPIEIIQSEKKNFFLMQKNEYSLGVLRDTEKHNQHRHNGNARRGAKLTSKGKKNERILAQHFPNLMEKLSIHVSSSFNVCNLGPLS